MGSRSRPVEVLQISSIDCGPAVVASLAQSFDLDVTYERVRELCRTEKDGTTIEAVEEALEWVGLHAEQSLIPHEHLIQENSLYTPAVVVMGSTGPSHFVIVWKVSRSSVYVMDPAKGNLKLSRRDFRRNLKSVRLAVDREDWLEYARSDDFTVPLRRRLREHLDGRAADAAIKRCLEEEGYEAFADLDAALRMIDVYVQSKALPKANVPAFWSRITVNHRVQREHVGESHYTIRPVEDDESKISYVGAVVVRVSKPAERTAEVAMQRSSPPPPAGGATPPPAPSPAASGVDASARRRRSASQYSAPVRLFVSILRQQAEPGLIGSVLVFSFLLGLTVLFESMLFGGLLNASEAFVRLEDQLGFVTLTATFFLCILLLRGCTALLEKDLGRVGEFGYRISLARIIRALRPRYFETRPVADLAQRFHTIDSLHESTTIAARLLRSTATVMVHAIAISHFNLVGGIVGVATALLLASLPFFFWRRARELDMRLQTFAGNLSLYYQQALRGRAPLNAHGANDIVVAEHEKKLTAWRASSEELVTLRTSALLSQELVSAIVLIVMVLLLISEEPTTSLLLVFWFVQLTTSSGELGSTVLFEFATIRNALARLYEPFSDTEQEPEPDDFSAAEAQRLFPKPVSIRFENVSVVESGHSILRNVNLKIPAGFHVAVVGKSGAGKSTLAGLILGSYAPSEGHLQIDNVVMDDQLRRKLLKCTAWADPGVHLWNESLLRNITGPEGMTRPDQSVEQIVDLCQLIKVIQNLPLGAASSIGEEGRMLSGGEGQRVRLARALSGNPPALVVLDEAFRGLDRHLRKYFLKKVRAIWKDTTLMMITHDIEDAMEFDLVVVVDGGRVVEAGSPKSLEQEGVFFRRMLEEHDNVQRDVWHDPEKWTRLELEKGSLEVRAY